MRFSVLSLKNHKFLAKSDIYVDRYVASSLKSYTGTTRRAGDLIQYEIHDKTKIGHLETKESLDNNETKNDLTQYVAEKLVAALATVACATVFGSPCKTRNKEIYLRTVYETLGKEICKALLGFHAFTGWDQTGRFYGYSKLRCWIIFMPSNESRRNAF